MARNKYPEKTIAHILEVSTTLFMQKGYEKTTIQDIIDALQMSKGAIYHHFRSKDEILQAVIKQRNVYAKELFLTLIHTITADTAKEKLIKILNITLLDQKSHAIDSILASQIRNPQFVVAGIQSTILSDSPIIASLFKAGTKDGSLTCEDPTICAEVFLLLMNTWINPYLFYRNIEETRERLFYLQKLLRYLGADIMTNQLIELVVCGYQNMGAFNKE